MDPIWADPRRLNKDEEQLAPLTSVGQYTLLQRIAVGPLSEVFAAEAKGSTTEIAVERFREELGGDKHFGDALVAQARLAALLSHPNVAQLFDLGQDEAGLYVVKQRVHGITLREIVDVRFEPPALTPPTIARLGAACAEALAGAHALHVADGEPFLHGNLTPRRIVVDYDGIPRVLDFGVAAATQPYRRDRIDWADAELPYRAPEQMLGEAVDCRVDVYALGIIMFELLACCRPYTATSEAELLQCTRHGLPPSARVLVESTPVELDEIVRRCMAPNKDDRYDSAEQLAADLRRFEHDNPPESDMELAQTVRELATPSRQRDGGLEHGTLGINTHGRATAVFEQRPTAIMATEEIARILHEVDDTPDQRASRRTAVVEELEVLEPDDDVVFSSINAWIGSDRSTAEADDWELQDQDDDSIDMWRGAEPCSAQPDDWVLYRGGHVVLETPRPAELAATHIDRWTVGPTSAILDAPGHGSDPTFSFHIATGIDTTGTTRDHAIDPETSLRAGAAPRSGPRGVTLLTLAAILFLLVGLVAAALSLGASFGREPAQSEATSKPLDLDATHSRRLESAPAPQP